MIAVISSLLMFLCLLTGALVHIINRQSKSYFLIAGYLLGTVIIALRIQQSGSFVDFGIWVAPMCLIALGEVIRFHSIENYISDKLNSVVKREGLHLPFNFFHNLPTGIVSELFTFKSIVVHYKSAHAIILHAIIDEPVEFTLEDFNMHIKSLDGTTIVQYKGLEHKVTSSGQDFTAGTTLRIVPSGGNSKVEIVLRDRVI